MYLTPIGPPPHETPARNTRLQHGISLLRDKLAGHWRSVHCRKPRPAKAVKQLRPAHLQPRAVANARHGRNRLRRAVRVDGARRARLVADVALEGAGGAGRARVLELIGNNIFHSNKCLQLIEVDVDSARCKDNKNELTACNTGMVLYYARVERGTHRITIP